MLIKICKKNKGSLFLMSHLFLSDVPEEKLAQLGVAQGT
jgi:hypothetical protein